MIKLCAARCLDCSFVRYSANPFLAGIKGDRHAKAHHGHRVETYNELGDLISRVMEYDLVPTPEPPF